MPLQGKFIINNAVYSPLIIYGVGTFFAFSGNGSYRNRGGCVGIPNNGPIPNGRYWIIDRPQGGMSSKVQTYFKDLYNRIVNDAEFDHGDWFALYRDDMNIDDYTWVQGVKRGNFRLHPGQVSEGCITLASNSDYSMLRNAILRTTKQRIPNTNDLMSYGMIEVIANGQTCS